MVGEDALDVRDRERSPDRGVRARVPGARWPAAASYSSRRVASSPSASSTDPMKAAPIPSTRNRSAQGVSTSYSSRAGSPPMPCCQKPPTTPARLGSHSLSTGQVLEHLGEQRQRRRPHLGGLAVEQPDQRPAVAGQLGQLAERGHELAPSPRSVRPRSISGQMPCTVLSTVALRLPPSSAKPADLGGAGEPSCSRSPARWASSPRQSTAYQEKKGCRSRSTSRSNSAMSMRAATRSPRSSRAITRSRSPSSSRPTSGTRRASATISPACCSRRATYAGPGDRVAVRGERAGQRPRVVEPPCHRDRLLGELATSLVGGGEGQRHRQPGQHERPRHRVVGAETVQRLLEQVGLHPVPEPHLEAGQARGETEGRPREQVGVVGAPPEIRGGEERLASPVEVARAEPGLARRGAGGRGGAVDPASDQLERAVAPAHGVLVGQHGRGRARGVLRRGGRCVGGRPAAAPGSGGAPARLPGHPCARTPRRSARPPRGAARDDGPERASRGPRRGPARGRSRAGRRPASPARRRPGRRPARPARRAAYRAASPAGSPTTRHPAPPRRRARPRPAGRAGPPDDGWWPGPTRAARSRPSPRRGTPRACAISETKSGLPPVRSVTARVSSSPGSRPVVAVISVRTSSAGSPRSSHDSPRVATWAASSRCSAVTSASWSRQPQTTRTARSERSVVRNCSSRNDPASTQCTSSSRSTTGRSRARSSITPSTASNNGNRPGTSTCASPVPSSNGTASRPRSPHCSGGRTPAAARTTWDQTQNDGVPGSSHPVPRRTVQPSARAATSASTRVLPMPASPWIQSTPAVPRAAVRQQRVGPGEDVVTTEQWLACSRRDSSLKEGTGSG